MKPRAGHDNSPDDPGPSANGDMNMRLATAFLMPLAFLFVSCDASAQPFPGKPVRIIVAFPPGGGVDIVARTMGPRLTEIWNQPIVIENRPGASGVIGTEAAARSAPDGHTLFIGTLGNLTANQYLYPKMAVDPLRDLAPLTHVVAVHFVMTTHPSVPAKNVKELIALAKARPDQLRLIGTRWRAAPRGRTVQVDDQGQHAPYPLQRQRPELH